MATMKTIFILKCGWFNFFSLYLFICSFYPIPFTHTYIPSHSFNPSQPSIPFILSIHVSLPPIPLIPSMHPFYPFHPSIHLSHPLILSIHHIYSSHSINHSTYHIFPIQLVILFIPFIHSVLQDDYTKIQLDNTLPKIPSTFSTSHFVGNEKRVEDLLQREGNFLGSFLVEKKR